MSVTFPCAIVADGAVLAVYFSEQAIAGPDGVVHAGWWQWSSAEWQEICPGWTALPVTDAPPAVSDGQVAVQNGQDQWTVGDDAVTATYTMRDQTTAEKRVAILAALAALDSRMPRTVEDWYTRLKTDSPTQYAALPSGATSVHAERVALRAKLDAL